MNMKCRILLKILAGFGKTIICVACILATFIVFGSFTSSGSTKVNISSEVSPNYGVVERYDKYMTNEFSDALDGILSIKKVYWLRDEDQIAPEPNQACFGETDDPKQMQAIIDKAQDLLDGQELKFSTDVVLRKGSKIQYYYDETILVITWKIVLDNSVYSLSEVKIADASQFRRFLSDGKYGSGTKYLTREMAETVNAVVAVNGDYYSLRQCGPIVQDGQIKRLEGELMDSCYIDTNGDFNFVRLGKITKRPAMEQYIADNNIRFSISFGPILVDEGKLVRIRSPYAVGEGGSHSPRAALCQVDSLHYLIVLTSPEPPYTSGHTLTRVGQRIAEMGVDKAYNLDGGRSGTLVMNDKLVNHVYERKISDILYFATAISSGE